MAKVKQSLENVEEKRLKIDDEKKGISPRLDELADKRKAAETRLAQAAAAEALGEKDGNVAAIRKEIADLDEEVEYVTILVEGLRAEEMRLKLEETAIKLGASDGELLQLIPELEKLEKQYLEFRRHIVEIVQEFNKKRKRAGQLRIAIPELREKLGLPDPHDMTKYGDIPNLNWNDSSIGISTEQLRGERPW